MFAFDDVELSGPLPLLLSSTDVPGTVVSVVDADAAATQTTPQIATSAAARGTRIAMFTAFRLRRVSKTRLQMTHARLQRRLATHPLPQGENLVLPAAKAPKTSGGRDLHPPPVDRKHRCNDDRSG